MNRQFTVLPDSGWCENAIRYHAHKQGYHAKKSRKDRLWYFVNHRTGLQKEHGFSMEQALVWLEIIE